MSESELALITEFGSSFGTSLQVVTAGNFFLNLLLSASMATLWGMINSLQMLNHLPLYRISMPLNARVFFITIASILQFDLVPVDSLTNFIFDFDEE